MVSLSNFAKTDIAEKIKQGGVISVNDENAHYFYKRVENSDDVLVLVSFISSNNHGELYVVFILVFYGAIAGIIFLWV